MDAKVEDCSGFLQKRSFSDAAKKLKKYFVDGSQPGMTYFEVVRSFDPFQINVLDATRKLAEYIGTPFAQLEILKDKQLKDEWPVYVAIAKEVRSEDVVCYSGEAMLVKTENLKMFWNGIKSRVPHLFSVADVLLCGTCTSADAERSFSKLNNVLCDQRQSLNFENMSMLTYLYFNSN